MTNCKNCGHELKNVKGVWNHDVALEEKDCGAMEDGKFCGCSDPEPEGEA